MMEYLIKAKPGKMDSSTEVPGNFLDSSIVEPNKQFDLSILEPYDQFDSAIGKSNKLLDLSETEPRKYLDFSTIEPNQQSDNEIKLGKNSDATMKEPNEQLESSEISSIDMDLPSPVELVDVDIEADPSTVKPKSYVLPYFVPPEWVNYTTLWYCCLTLLLYFTMCRTRTRSVQYFLNKKQAHILLK